ncbi:MAG TPA: IclR family transcriptional regulator C-terminal domain-containing protein [Xanthobacteraceae bacterium]|jgi:IclR family pca regulon transcriptional regulator|nr:IclR family transcriptional regulator C-terminal domain-containing protein [Xanthobacteraceae bacterium]
MDASQDKQTDRNFMVGLGKGLAVIECFDERRERLTISEVADMTKLSRAAARRCLLTLQALGYAQYDGKFFRLTPRVLRLGYAFLASAQLPRLLQPFLDRLSEEFSESCSASILGESEIVYIARSAKQRIMSVDLGVGSRLPAYCTSMGRVLLAALDPEEAKRRLLAGERRKLTAHTHTSIEELMEILAQVRAQGYCVIDQELEVGLVSIAVPVFDASGRTATAINMGAQSARIPASELPGRVLGRLLEAQRMLQPLIKS